MKILPDIACKMAAAVLVLLSSPVFAGGLSCYETTLNLRVSPIETFDTVIFEWSGEDVNSDDQIWQSGLHSEMSDLKMELWSGGTLVYTDIIIADGAAQPFGDQTRDLLDIYWEFDASDLTGPTLRQMVNIFEVESPTGTHYQVADGLNLPDDGKVYMWKYLDGVVQLSGIGDLDTQVTLKDSDCDGMFDGVDECPVSDLGPTVVIGGCDSEVPNTLFATGCSISDLVAEQAALASNHGSFVSGVAHLVNDLNDAGAISGAQHGAIQACVARH
jgi:hypothetical protein